MPACPARQRLVSGSCSSARSFALRFLPTLGRPHAVALRFVRCDQLTVGLSPTRVRPCWAHIKKGRRIFPRPLIADSSSLYLIYIHDELYLLPRSYRFSDTLVPLPDVGNAHIVLLGNFHECLASPDPVEDLLLFSALFGGEVVDVLHLAVDVNGDEQVFARRNAVLLETIDITDSVRGCVILFCETRKCFTSSYFVALPFYFLLRRDCCKVRQEGFLSSGRYPQ